MSSAALMSEAISGTSFQNPQLGVGILPATEHSLRKDSITMTKTLDVITEIIRNPKHPFRKADDRPDKAQKHRYERRKIKEFIKLGSWAQEEVVT
jgi:hypothetical protein